MSTSHSCNMNSKYPRFCLALFSAVLFLSGCAATVTLPGDGSKRAPIRVSQTSRGVLITAEERILFRSGESAIAPNGQEYIDRLVKILKEKTKEGVLVEGHTDNVGDPQFNQKLSEARAAAVRSALVRGGISASRVSTKGHGMSQPVADNKSEAGRQQNRRTDILILNETIEGIGGATAAERLSEGFSNFLKDPVGSFKDAFGG